jgi:hypothetical protein
MGEGLGFGQISSANGSGSGFERKKCEGGDGGEEDVQGHVDTPGTFGLEGEAERRMMRDGMNPYFA